MARAANRSSAQPKSLGSWPLIPKPQFCSWPHCSPCVRVSLHHADDESLSWTKVQGPRPVCHPLRHHWSPSWPTGLPPSFQPRRRRLSSASQPFLPVQEKLPPAFRTQGQLRVCPSQALIALLSIPFKRGTEKVSKKPFLQVLTSC